MPKTCSSVSMGPQRVTPQPAPSYGLQDPGSAPLAPCHVRVCPSTESYPSSDDAQEERNAIEEDAHEPVCPRRSLARVVGGYEEVVHQGNQSRHQECPERSLPAAPEAKPCCGQDRDPPAHHHRAHAGHGVHQERVKLGVVLAQTSKRAAQELCVSGTEDNAGECAIEMQRRGYCDRQCDIDHSEDKEEDHRRPQPTSPSKTTHVFTSVRDAVLAVGSLCTGQAWHHGWLSALEPGRRRAPLVPGG